MQLFYTPKIADLLELPKDESRHLIQVLRKGIGDEVHFTDGRGLLCVYEVWQDNPKRTVLKLLEKEYHPSAGPELSIAIAPTKNIDRIEWFLEKSTEIGVNRVVPFISAHSERKKVRLDRMEKILIAAMKQSQQYYKPEITELHTFEEVLEMDIPGQKFICHQRKGEQTHLFNAIEPESDVFVLIGPEGDFSNQEVDMALKAGFSCVTLGANRLRTETAGVVVSQLFQAKNI